MPCAFVMHEYDLIADWYAADRSRDIGVPEVTALAVSLPTGASVLDIGCGTGIPVTRALLAAGCSVLAIDSSSRMFDKFRANFPDIPTLCAAIQSCDLQSLGFDAAVAWGVMFHLDQGDQARALANVSRALKPGAPFLFTSGDRDGSVEGEMNGVPFRYFSLSVDGYRSLLNEHGFQLIESTGSARQTKSAGSRNIASRRLADAHSY